MTEFNNYHSNIKFIYEWNKENITFLDLIVSLAGNKLTEDIHTKSTGKHQYLHFICTPSLHQTFHFLQSGIKDEQDLIL